MARLSSAADCIRAWHRLANVTSDDDALVEAGDATNAVALTCLTHGIEAAQAFMIACGMTERWKTRSQAITSWSGSDAADGGRYKSLTDIEVTDKPFLKLAGKRDDAKASSMTQADGQRWGTEIDADRDMWTGNYFYLKGNELWLARRADVPASVYLLYLYRHPEFTTTVTLDFPTDALGLVVAYAAAHGQAEGWSPRSGDDKARVDATVTFWERRARMVARRTRGPRKQNAPRITGTRFWR